MNSNYYLNNAAWLSPSDSEEWDFSGNFKIPPQPRRQRVPDRTNAPASELPELMLIEEAAAYLRVSPRQIYREIADGKIAVIYVAKRSPRIRRSELERYIATSTASYGS